MADLLEDEEWKDMIAEYGKVYFMSKEERDAATKGLVGKREFTLPMFACCMGGYGAERLKDKELADRVWKTLLNSLIGIDNEEGFTVKELPDTGNRKELGEIAWISTNFVAQFCLNVIMTLEFIRDELPKTLKDVRKLIDSGSNFRKA